MSNLLFGQSLCHHPLLADDVHTVRLVRITGTGGQRKGKYEETEDRDKIILQYYSKVNNHMPVKYMMTDSAYLHYYRLGFILQRLVFKETGQVKEKGHQDLIKLFTPGHR